MKSLRAIIGLCLLGIAFVATADPQRYVSSVARERLVELYTSEGCSSCPPADRWFSRLQQDPRLWRQIVPVAFHVDYWDGLGWKDRFASPAYSLRQRRYARAGGLSQVYTPALVVGGREWQGWFRDPALRLPPANDVGVLTLTVEGSGRGTVRFQAIGAAKGALTACVAVLGFDLTTSVKAGENRGRRLRHDFVVLGLTEVRLRRHGNEFQASFTLPAASQPAKRKAVAAWVGAGGGPVPLQAVGGWYVDR